MDEYFNLKLADFGSSAMVEKSSQYGDRKGTVLYMAPEVDRLEPGNTFDALKADLYSLGVCLHVMLFGEYPGDKNFGGCHSSTGSAQDDHSPCPATAELKCLREQCRGRVSEDCQEVLASLLSNNPHKRVNPQELLHTSWLSNRTPGIEISVYDELSKRKAIILDKRRPQPESPQDSNF